MVAVMVTKNDFKTETEWKIYEIVVGLKLQRPITKTFGLYRESVIYAANHVMWAHGLNCMHIAHSNLIHTYSLKDHSRISSSNTLEFVFSNAQELDEGAGHLIRERGTACDSNNFIGDKFLPISVSYEHLIVESLNTQLCGALKAENMEPIEKL